MPIPTPFHTRTSAICESYEWRNWSGYLLLAYTSHHTSGNITPCEFGGVI